MKKTLSHVDEAGKARMVDVGDKAVTRRMASASARITTNTTVIGMIRKNAIAKGDVLGIARVAGILAAKKTADLIPLCHSLPLDSVAIDFEIVSRRGRAHACIEIRSTVRCTAKTGAEMEALTAASVAALTIYDMCKAVDRTMTVEGIRLEEKSGGKSGHFVRRRR